MTAERTLKWRDYRFLLFDRNPQIFDAFEFSLEELQSMVFDFSERKKYDLTRHALNELLSIISAYLIARDKSLRVPTSTMALFDPSNMRFDAVLTRQLERFKAHAARGISNSDQEFVKQVASILANLSLASLETHSYFTENNENSVTSFVSAYLNGTIQDAAVRGLDDVALEGADHLRDVCTALTRKGFYINAITQVGNLENLANVSLLRKSDVVLSAAVRCLSDCLLHDCLYGHPRTHVISHLLESLMRVTRARLTSPLGLEASIIPFSVGPFISPTERSSFAAVNIAVANGIIAAWRSDDHETRNRWIDLYGELHERAWLDFAELGMNAVMKNSFLLHYINSTMEEVVRVSFHLINVLNVPDQPEERGYEAAREWYHRRDFVAELRDKMSWETTGVYSRIIPSMFEHKNLNFLGDTIKEQALFAFWAMRSQLEKIALDATERIFKACMKLQDPEYRDVYGSARLGIHIAQIGIYARALDQESIFKVALERYATLRQTFRERHPDARYFVGNFDSAESTLLEERGPLIFDALQREFFSTATTEQIHAFFAALK